MSHFKFGKHASHVQRPRYSEIFASIRALSYIWLASAPLYFVTSRLRTFPRKTNRKPKGRLFILCTARLRLSFIIVYYRSPINSIHTPDAPIETRWNSKHALRNRASTRAILQRFVNHRRLQRKLESDFEAANGCSLSVLSAFLAMFRV